MAKPTPAKLLPDYRASLARYVAEHDHERARVERLLIADLERQAAEQEQKKRKGRRA